MSVSVVILNYNGKKHLAQFLPDVVRYSPDAQIVVADNGSTDGSVDFLKNNFSDVKLICFERNYGFAEGYNLALKNLSSDYFVLLNSDVLVTENWLKILIDFLQNNSQVSACQPKIRSFYDRQKFEYAGACGGFIDEYGYPFCRGRIFDTLETDNAQYDDIAEIFWATGACLAIRATDFWQAGALDGRFFAHQEEIDLCWRLKARGKSIVCVPKSVVFHVGGGTLNVESPMKTYLNFRNNLLLLYKNLPENRLKKVFFVRFFLDIFAALILFLQGKKENAAQIFNAKRDFRKMRKDFSPDRAHNLSLTQTPHPLGMLKGLILFKYHLKNLKTFGKVLVE